jgi:hypothetical protein
MHQEHEWIHDIDASIAMNAKCCGNPAACRYSIHRCSKCGCIRITDGSCWDEGRVKYKPNEWTWNPFKTLKDEPSCPAKW